MQEKIIGIYKVENLINHKVYIGQSVDVLSRFGDHKNLGVNYHLPSRPLYNSIKKYGVENFSFDIIRECKEEDLDFYEIVYIRLYCSWNRKYGYNLTLGGSGVRGYKYTEEDRKKISDASKKAWKTSEKFKAYNKRRVKGWRKNSEETKKLMSEKAKLSWKKGRDISNYNGGVTEENREQKVLQAKNRRTVYKNGVRKVVKSEELEKYLLEGWERPKRLHKLKVYQKSSNNKKEKLIKISKNDKETFIPLSELDSYIKNGWKKGRSPFSDETKRKMSESAKKRCRKIKPITTLGRKWMLKNGNRKMVKPDEVQEYLNDGWVFGFEIKKEI